MKNFLYPKGDIMAKKKKAKKKKAKKRK